MATYSQLTFPGYYQVDSSINRYIKGDNHLIMGGHPIILLYGGSSCRLNISSTWIGGPGSNDYDLTTDRYLKLNFRIKLRPTGLPFGSENILFNIFGKDFTNFPFTDLTSITRSVQSSNYFKSDIDNGIAFNYIEDMFDKNRILEDFNLSNYTITSYLGYDYMEFSLTCKNEGIYNINSNMVQWQPIYETQKVYLVSDFYRADPSGNTFSYYDNITFSSIDYYDGPIGGTNSYPLLNNINQHGCTITYKVPKGINISSNSTGFKLGLNIYKVNEDYNILNHNSSSNLLTSIVKKGVGLVDFDPSNIILNSLEDWKPNIYDFDMRCMKYIDKFSVRAFQDYTSVNYENSNFISYDEFDKVNTDNKRDFFYVIDAYDNLFDNYNVPNTITLDQEISPNLDRLNSGSYSTFNNFVYDRNLTKQPRYKELNKSYEILYTQSYNVNQLVGSLHYDKAYLEFFFVGTSSTEIIELSDTSTFQAPASEGGTFRWINQLCFNTSNLKNRISGTWSDVYLIEAHFLKPDYCPIIGSSSFPVTYETQQYYINNTEQYCDDNINEEIDYVPVVFKNSKGGFDLFEFDSVIELKTKRNYDSFISPYTYKSTKTSEFEKVFNLDYGKSYRIKTRLLNSDEFVWLEDLVKSKKVYILNLNDNNLYPIIIQDTDYGFSNNSSDRQISITFNYSRPELTN